MSATVRPGVWLRAARVHQWAKNVLVFVPLFVGHAYNNPNNILLGMAGFVLICLLASAAYVLNDVADLDADRLHQTKRLRAIASGDLSIRVGIAAASIVIVIVLVAADLLVPGFALTLLMYLVLTLAYSFALKKLPLLDVLIIAILLTLRIVMGTALLGLAYSPWLLSFAGTFFLSLALAKRHVEIKRADKADLKTIPGRGYRADDWPLTLSFGTGAGLTSIVIMLLYLADDAAPSGFYSNARWLYAIPALMTMWLMRIWLMSNRMELDDDPVVFALKDHASLALGIGAALAFALAI